MLIPNWFWTLLFFTSVVAIIAAWILKRIPFVNKNAIILNIAGTILAMISIWFMGASSNEAKWQAEVDKLKEQLKVKEEQAANKNVEIQKEIVYKDRFIQGKTKTQIEYIDRELVKKEEIVKYIENCPVPKEIIDEVNKAATKGEVK
jgi:hypothetical protein